MFDDIFEHLDWYKFQSIEQIAEEIIAYRKKLIEGFTPCDEDWQEAKAIAKDYAKLRDLDFNR